MLLRISLIHVILMSLLVTSDAVENYDTLVVCYASAPPFLIEEESQVVGSNIWLWDRIPQDLNIVYRLEPMDFGSILDGLQSGNIDLSINPLTMTAPRSQVFVFTSPFYVSNATILMQCSGRWNMAWKVISTVLS
ncbi:MAG: polar amino acid transport system substrate-binding protein [Saprospiraceae bacterium]|jgi:polar amino acid transport system substrate-binding protein